MENQTIQEYLLGNIREQLDKIRASIDSDFYPQALLDIYSKLIQINPLLNRVTNSEFKCGCE